MAVTASRAPVQLCQQTPEIVSENRLQLLFGVSETRWRQANDVQVTVRPCQLMRQLMRQLMQSQCRSFRNQDQPHRRRFHLPVWPFVAHTAKPLKPGCLM